MLKIKKGESIFPYGLTGGFFTEESELSQAILEHLQTRFPEKIEDSSKIKKSDAEKTPEELQAEADAKVKVEADKEAARLAKVKADEEAKAEKERLKAEAKAAADKAKAEAAAAKKENK